MNRFNNCTFILLGHENQDIALDNVKALCRAVTNHDVVTFNIEEAKEKLVGDGSALAETLKRVISSGKILQDNFYDMMIETFLHKNRLAGPVAFTDFPKTVSHARCLTKALRLFGRDIVIVLNFNSGKSKKINDVALHLKGTPKYVYFDIKDEEQLKSPCQDLAKNFARFS